MIGALIAVSFLSFVKFPKEQQEKVSSSVKQVFVEMKEGLATIWSIPAIKWSFIYGIFVLFALMPAISLLPLMAKNHFAGGEFELTLVQVGYSIGTLLGGLALAFWKPKIHALTLVCFALVFFGIGFVISGILPQNMVFVFVALLLVIGIVSAVEQSAIQAFNQTKVPQEKMGRVMSLNFTVSVIPSIIGLLFVAAFTDFVGGVGNVFIIAGIILVVVGLLQWLTPAIRKTIVEDSKEAESVGKM